MIELGNTVRCQMDRIEPEGLVMQTMGEEPVEILVQPILEIPFIKGKEYPVFILKRFSDCRFSGSLKIPEIQLNEVQFYPVSRIISAGIYLDWGVEMPLFIPKSMVTGIWKEGMMAPVRLIRDEKSGQLIGDMQWKRQLLPADENDFFRSQEVDIMVMEPTEIGHLVLVNQYFSGMVYFNQVFKPLRLGEKRIAFINKVREDGKLDILLQRPGYGEVIDGGAELLNRLKLAGGRLPFGDKTPPELIASQLNMSKKVFKKVAGSLYKSGKVGISDMAIWLLEDEGD